MSYTLLTSRAQWVAIVYIVADNTRCLDAVPSSYFPLGETYPSSAQPCQDHLPPCLQRSPRATCAALACVPLDDERVEESSTASAENVLEDLRKG